MKKLVAGFILLAASIGWLASCNTKEYNLRTIRDSDRNYISADSTEYEMAWKTESWRNDHIFAWSSAGIIITNEYNLLGGDDQAFWLKKVVEEWA